MRVIKRSILKSVDHWEAVKKDITRELRIYTKGEVNEYSRELYEGIKYGRFNKSK